MRAPPLLLLLLLFQLIKTPRFNFRWLEDYSEHVTSVRKSESGVDSILFPSAKSIRTRVALAEEYGAGISIWELGQGFASFLDELALVKRKTVAGSERHEELRR